MVVVVVVVVVVVKMATKFRIPNGVLFNLTRLFRTPK
jgi:hypothetical protein